MSFGTEGADPRSHADFAALWGELEGRESYWETLARLQFSSSVRAHLRAHAMSQVELAERLGWKPAQVSRALRGGQNLTLRSMVRISRALGLRLEVCAVAEDAPFAGVEAVSRSVWPALGAGGESPLEVAEHAKARPGPRGGRRASARLRISRPGAKRTSR